MKFFQLYSRTPYDDSPWKPIFIHQLKFSHFSVFPIFFLCFVILFLRTPLLVGRNMSYFEKLNHQRVYFSKSLFFTIIYRIRWMVVSMCTNITKNILSECFLCYGVDMREKNENARGMDDIIAANGRLYTSACVWSPLLTLKWNFFSGN